MSARKAEADDPVDAEKGQEAAAEEVTDDPTAEASSTPAAENDGDDGIALVEAPEDAVRRLTDAVDELRDRHLRLAAEYENFRKRTARERTETWTRAQANVVGNILDALDDLGRVLDVDIDTASTADVVSGVELVERKIVRELQTAGLERVGAVGEPFDPNHHEAVGSVPATASSEDHTVADVLQIGYRFGGALLRPAKVRVFMWQSGGEEHEG